MKTLGTLDRLTSAMAVLMTVRDGQAFIFHYPETSTRIAAFLRLGWVKQNGPAWVLTHEGTRVYETLSCPADRVV